LARPDRQVRPPIIRPRQLLGVPSLIRSLGGEQDYFRPFAPSSVVPSFALRRGYSFPFDGLARPGLPGRTT